MISPADEDLGPADVIIVGAGLAGLSCAFELAERGQAVLLLEAQPWVGGRTASWTESDGMRVESGLHRMLGVYRAFPDLLRRAGIDPDAAIIWEDEVEFRQPVPEPPAVFSVAPLRNPLQMLADIVGHNDYLPATAKLSMSRFVAQGLADYAADPDALDRKSVLEYAVEQNVQSAVISKLLEPLVAGIYFVPAAKLSAKVFMALIAPYLPNAAAMRVGAFAGGMTEVFAAPLAEAVRRRGGRVRTSARVEELLVEGGRAAGVRVAGRELRARHVVLASSIRATQALLAAKFGGEAWVQSLLRLPTMPAVTLQLELEGPSMNVDHTTFGVGTSLACFSEQSRTTFRGLAGRLSIIMAPADELIGLPVDRVLTIALEDADRLGLVVRDRVTRYRMVNHVDDFYSLAPGHDALRPPQITPVPGLTLAGDYTRQEFVATMEGAVVSGQLAARAVLG
ncbi:hydroxysqualene dehydroxylase [Opitutus terrae]|uniref:Carotene 7,8-desaturase n=1 Tax=Opitutus terrae (strain DSM 11246 / JCM 15787 / PB90-1) TaxID=452637 RepID=B2A073_OPITP|nr:FAD-dependent oxidoreductase [Opitutus terrae]ACB77409.1 Carotene 7,8-desaturase [Opitutus terrae PB90-1]